MLLLFRAVCVSVNRFSSSPYHSQHPFVFFIGQKSDLAHITLIF